MHGATSELLGAPQGSGSLASYLAAIFMLKCEVLRILGLQLCALELAWLLERRQIYGDHLLRANEAPQRAGRDAEAKHLSLQALRLNAEVRAMQTEMVPETGAEVGEFCLSVWQLFGRIGRCCCPR